MRITYDNEVDALYTQFIEMTVTTCPVAEGIAVDYAVDGRIAGIETLDAQKRFGDPQVSANPDRGYCVAVGGQRSVSYLRSLPWERSAGAESG